MTDDANSSHSGEPTTVKRPPSTSTRVDILLATHNGGPWIGHQIESIIAQTHGEWRLLVSDDCSSDDTLDIIRDYETKDARIEIVSTRRRGSPVANFLSLLRYSEAEFSLLCDQDDHWEPNKIERLMEVLPPAGASAPALVASDASVVDDQLNLVAASFLKSSRICAKGGAFNKVLVQNPVLGCTSAFNRPLREIVTRIQLDTRQIIMHDWWLALVASAFGNLALLPDKLVRYRQHRMNQVGAFQYSAKNLLAASARGRQKTALILRQADYLNDCYGAEMPPSSRQALDSFIAAFKAPALWRPYMLARGGYVKSGVLRAVGQLAFAIDYRERTG